MIFIYLNQNVILVRENFYIQVSVLQLQKCYPKQTQLD